MRPAFGAADSAASTVARSSLSWAATEAELDASRDKAIAWLVLNQQADGRWVSAPGLYIQTTAAAVEALQAAGAAGNERREVRLEGINSALDHRLAGGEGGAV